MIAKHDLAVRWSDDSAGLARVRRLRGVVLDRCPRHLKVPGGVVAVVTKGRVTALRYVVEAILGPRRVRLPGGQERSGYLIKAKPGSIRQPTEREKSRLGIRWYAIGHFRYFTARTGKVVLLNPKTSVTRAISKTHPPTNAMDPRIVSSPQNHQLDYQVQTKTKVIRAEKVEAVLLEDYRRWLAQQRRKLSAVKYRTLQCDAYEADRRNLIEAKSSARREHIRMAVGQLLDYAFQGNRKFRHPHKAILLPSKPASDIVDWLDSLKIKIVWRKKKAFFDNANGQFT